jgi:DNA-binding transcriptional LysR family regulator
VFLAVAEEQHVGRAALKLGVTQSAVSQQIQAMERELGYAVFLHGRRPLALTSGGRTLRVRAQAIAREAQRIQSDRARFLKELPSLELGVLSSIASVVAPIAVELGKAELRAERVGIRTGLATDHLQLIQEGQADLAITSDPLLDLEGLRRTDVIEEWFVLVLPQGWTQSLDDLPALGRLLPMVRFGYGAPAGRVVDQHLRRRRIELPRTIEVDRVSAVVSVVEAGQGFAILSPTLLLDALQRDAGISVCALPGAALTRRITTVYRDRELDGFAATLSKRVGRAIAGYLGAQATSGLRQHVKLRLRA